MQAAGIDFDFSRQRVDGKTLELLAQLARETGVESLREAMFAGVHINSTEDRAVLHTALRLPQSATLHVDGQDVVADVHEILQRMADFSEQVRSGSWTGATGETITDIVNIGIGGSDLGPAMAYRALAEYVQPGLRCHFVSNVDPADVTRTLVDLDPARTLVIVASKTFTTAETMSNAQVVRTWLVDRLGESSVPRHFVAVSTNADAVRAFGIDAANMFGFWDWVGGRYSMDSAIGLSTMIAIGPVNFHALLDGFHAMDEHFRSAPLERNAPALMGLLAVWNRDFLGIPTTAVLPYAQDLARFPAYLQQLTMESNGKSVRRDGTPVDYPTGGIYWGEPGTGGQHSFYQLLHQGTDDVACDIIISAHPTVAQTPQIAAQHDMLVANALAQAAVLSVGRSAQEVRDSGVPEALAPHKVMPGNRPVSVVMAPEISPFTLGALIAAYEHSVFVQGAVWQINSFDQWGVELGKSVAVAILDDINADSTEDPALDPATRDSLSTYLAYRRS
jgi:glucose-6-phosphate isomerase